MRRPDENAASARVAQEEEHLAETQEAAGSMPAASTAGARPVPARKGR